MKNPKINIEEAAEIFAIRFESGTTKRSAAYQAGFSERLQLVATAGKHKTKTTHKPGTVEFDAYFSGFEHALNSIDVFVNNKNSLLEDQTYG